MTVIGIAGGSGAGKSTVSYALVDSDPSRFEVINLDDYQRPKDDPDLPTVDGMINWDHPDVIRWQDLRGDIGRLTAGEAVHIDVWAHRSNSDYAQTRRMLPRTIYPRPVIIVEGYRALYATILDIYEQTFYLDLDPETRAQRRREARGGKDTIIGVDNYVEKVLNPMYQQFVEPTRQNADVVIDVNAKSVDEMVGFILEKLSPAIADELR